MGGRGTFAAGNPVPYSYKKVEEIEGVKVLTGINGKHALPESSHSSNAYIKLDQDGKFREMRFYDKNHVLRFEIGYHAEKSLTGNNHQPVLHYHIYDERFSKNASGNFYRSKAMKMTKAMKKRYKKYFKGLNL
jgi:hypothetical protein